MKKFFLGMISVFILINAIPITAMQPSRVKRAKDWAWQQRRKIAVAAALVAAAIVAAASAYAGITVKERRHKNKIYSIYNTIDLDMDQLKKSDDRAYNELFIMGARLIDQQNKSDEFKKTILVQFISKLKKNEDLKYLLDQYPNVEEAFKQFLMIGDVYEEVQ